MDLIRYCDANWVEDIDSRCSTSGYYVFLLENCAVFCCSKKQQSVSLSTTKLEYITIAQEFLWLKRLIKEIDNFCVQGLISLYFNNQSAIKLALR